MRLRGSRKKYCPFTSKKIPEEYIDFKNYRFLLKYVSETGKMVPSRITGLSAYYQRAIALAIKRARQLALIPYCDRH